MTNTHALYFVLIGAFPSEFPAARYVANPMTGSLKLACEAFIRDGILHAIGDGN